MKHFVLVVVSLGCLAVTNAEHAIMFDAGSSGTRVYIYEWTPTIEDGIIPTVTEVNNSRVTPGLSAQTEEGVAGYLAPLVEFCEEVIEEGDRADTPMFLKATAGMRLLPTEDADGIMQSVRAALGATAFDFRSAKTISGDEEGSFGWLTANYLRGTFNVSADGTSPASVGALDLGGASTQITFEPTTDVLDGYFPIRLGLQRQVEYNLYTHSFLRFGQDQVRERHYQDVIVNGDPNMAPCFFNGATFDVTNSQDDSTVTLTGSGDFDACRSTLRTLTLPETECFYADDRCSINGVYSPEIPDAIQFVAVSAYFYAASGVGFESGTLQQFITAATTHCSTPWADIEAGDDFSDFSINECFGAALAITYLVDSYGFATDREEQISFTSDINGVDAGWTLGATLYELSFVEIALGNGDNDEPSSATRTSLRVPALSAFVAIPMLRLLA